tara:strand:+ start:1656 stop:3092 length:1437 start_codon:yes stop_codon:yes gene_type:complete
LSDFNIGSQGEFERIRSKGFNQVPLFLTRPLEWTAQELFQGLEGSKILLDSSATNDSQHLSIIALSKSGSFSVTANTCRIEDRLSSGPVMERFESWLRQFKGFRRPGWPTFLGGVCGYFSYESARFMDDYATLEPNDYGIPDILFYVVDRCVVVDHKLRKIHLVASGDDYQNLVGFLRKLETELLALRPLRETVGKFSAMKSDRDLLEGVHSNFSQSQYEKIIENAKELIRSGETYQINLSQRFSKPHVGSPWQCYQRLTHYNPVPYAAFFPGEGFTIVSSSPECLVRKRGDRLSTRPIAGTRKKYGQAKTFCPVSELSRDPKERSEHAMLVDLARNDMSRVSIPGTVRVDHFCDIVPYKTLYHLESEVKGIMRSGLSTIDCFAGLFPGGTITGVPKRRTMELIRELEPNSRGIYTGSLGYITFCGDMDFNILIRSILFKNKMAYLNGGGGITVDAAGHLEFKETINKVRALLMALSI